jgi:succinate dehydrogenase/fumarate reductase-like Fe-S protein
MTDINTLLSNLDIVTSTYKAPKQPKDDDDIRTETTRQPRIYGPEACMRCGGCMKLSMGEGDEIFFKRPESG